MSREEIEKMLSELWEAMGNLGTTQPRADFKERFWARVREDEILRGSFRLHFIQDWRQRASLLTPVLAFAVLILVMLLGTYSALKVIPQAAADRQNKSPILLWVESASGDLKSGGITL